MPGRHGVNRWELRTCARRGHVTYAPDDETLAHRLSGLTGLGEVWRCLRCGEFTLGAPHGRGPADDAPMVLRGKALRQAIIVRARWNGGCGPCSSASRRGRCGSSVAPRDLSKPLSTGTCPWCAPVGSRSIR